MAVRIRFDESNNVIQPTFLLANRNGNKLGLVPAVNLHIRDNFTTCFELEFNVNKYADCKKYYLWDELKDFKLVHCPEFDIWFEISVELSSDGDDVKHVTAKAIGEAELSQTNLYDIEINTEADIAREDYKPTTLFDETDADASLLNRILEKAPHYTIKHVDASIARIQRVFSFHSTNIYDAFQTIAKEINCIFIIDSGTDENGKIARGIYVYDLESYCMDCKTRGEFLDKCSECGSENIKTGYGNDTNIFVSVENLADDIQYTTDVDSVKNCFKLEAGDDLMTAALVSCNPNGSGYIWYLSDEIKSDMSDELVNALDAYDRDYLYYQNEHTVTPPSDLRDAYNSLVGKYKNYRDDIGTIPEKIVGYAGLMNAYYDTIDLYLFLHDELMPSAQTQDTTAAEQVELLNSTSLSPVAVTDLDVCSESTATSAVLSMAKVIVDPRYRVKVSTSTYSNHVWYGSFKVTSYSDEEDTAETSFIRVSVNDNYEDFVNQRLRKSLSSATSNPSDITSLFALDIDDFKNQIKKYSLVSLQRFADACQGCIDILIEQGVANDLTWANTAEDLYNTIYLPYYNKLKALEEEIDLRESEIETVVGRYEKDSILAEDGMQTFIEKHNAQIHEKLNFEKSLGKELWLELIAYRREDTYSNANYISDGLTNKELFARAREFFEVARKEIFKSSTLQHSISATLKNLLVMKPFKPIVDDFCVGNWIRIGIDDGVYRLRLLSYEIDFDDPETLPVIFSDVTKTSDGVTDSESVLEQAASMATSYDSVKRQASQGKDTKNTLDDWVSQGLSLTKMKIIDSADDQNITWDNHGLLCRQYLPITDDYDDKQLKIINRGLYLTDDGWLTSRAGIGDFTYYNPETGKQENAYGVIADTLVGSLVLSQKVGVYNSDGSITLDEKGIAITTNGENVTGTQKVFTIRKKNTDENGVETLKNLMYVDNSGNLVFSGTLKGASGEFTGHIMATSLDGSYFKVDASTMGFYAFDDTPMLYYENGTMVLNGAIKAISQDGSYFRVDSDTMGFYTITDEPMFYYEDGIMVLNGAIKATGIDGSYFRVDSKAMGFFDRNGTPMLSYANGGLTLTGAINATSLSIINNGSFSTIDSYIDNSNALLGVKNDLSTTQGNLDETIDMLNSLEGRVDDVEFKVQDDQIVMAVRNSTAYQADLAAVSITDDRIVSVVTSSTAFTDVLNEKADKSTVSTMQTTIDQQADRIDMMATKSELNGEVTTLQASIDANSGLISTKITSAEAESLIQQSLTTIVLKANQIRLEGIVTANGNFCIDEYGTLTALNGIFSGSLTSGNWTFDGSGGRYVSGSNWLRMDFSGSTARFHANGYDVNYGSDSTHVVMIEGNDIVFNPHYGNQTAKMGYGTGRKGNDLDDISFIIEQSEHDNPKGNLGTYDTPWDTLYCSIVYEYRTGTGSTRKIKNDIQSLEDMGDVIDRLNPVSFEYKFMPGETRYGLIYEEVEPILPVICIPPDEKHPEPALNYTDLIPVLLKEIQSLRKRVSMLEA